MSVFAPRALASASRRADLQSARLPGTVATRARTQRTRGRRRNTPRCIAASPMPSSPSELRSRVKGVRETRAPRLGPCVACVLHHARWRSLVERWVSAESRLAGVRIALMRTRTLTRLPGRWGDLSDALLYHANLRRRPGDASTTEEDSPVCAGGRIGRKPSETHRPSPAHVRQARSAPGIVRMGCPRVVHCGLRTPLRRMGSREPEMVAPSATVSLHSGGALPPINGSR